MIWTGEEGEAMCRNICTIKIEHAHLGLWDSHLMSICYFFLNKSCLIHFYLTQERNFCLMHRTIALLTEKKLL